MTEQSTDIHVQFKTLGGGEVVLDLPPSSLNEPARLTNAPKIPYGKNLRLIQAVVETRPGYIELGSAPTADPVTGLYLANFDDSGSLLVRATGSSMHTLAAGVWTDRTSVPPPSVSDAAYWDFAMVPRGGSSTPQNLLCAVNGVDPPYKWDSVTAQFEALTGTPPAGAVTTSSFLNRAWLGNVLESGNRKHLRLWHSVTGNSEDWTNLGAGFVDLDDDPYPIADLAVMAGGQIVMKGSSVGGSIWRGTPTGNFNNPVRYDAVNPGAGIGLLLRRTFILLDPGRAFFVGHDGFYLYDGVNALRRVAEQLLLSILSRINQNALDSATAWYRQKTGEVHVAIPVGASDTPNEVWVYNIREDSSYGPYLYGANMTSTAVYIDIAGVTWPTFNYPGGWDTIPFDQWDQIVGVRGDATLVLGSVDGKVYNDRDNRTDTDDGTQIQAAYTCPEIIADGRLTNGQQRLGPHDLLAIRDITIEYRADTAWTPVVETSDNNGASFVLLSDGTQAGGGAGELKRKTWSPQLTAPRFMLRVSGNSPYRLYAIYARFRAAGDERSG